MNEQRLREIEEDISRDRALAYYYVEELLAEIRRLRGLTVEFDPFFAIEDRVARRLAEGFPKAQYADTTGLKDHPLMKRIERKG